MAKAPIEIRSLARLHTEEAITTLVKIMRDTKAPPAARGACAQALLDRGWGKAPQTTDVTVRHAAPRELSDHELANIALGSSEGTADAPIDPSQLN